MSSSRRVCILVLGMHRSGTSALAGALGAMGGQLPKRAAGPRIDNPNGFFEPIEIILTHDRLLAAAGTSWSDFDAIPSEWFGSQEAERFADELEAALRIDYADAPLFVVKDPRICRLVPLWRQVLARV